MKKVPEIRFAEYVDDWEQRKLGDISESFDYGLNAAATEYDGKHKYIRITDIDDSTHLFLQENLTSPDIDFSNADDYLLKEGDVLFARTGASVGKTYIYRRSDGDLYFAGFLIRAKIKSDYDADFVFQNTLTDSYNSYIRITSQRSGQPGVNAQEYANFELSVPSLAEQKKIGAYFSKLNNLITLHQRKLEKLMQFKSSMLEKMFPKNGESVPEIRFAGFTDAWEQRELSRITFPVGQRNKDDLDLEPYAITNDSGFIPQKDAHDEFGYMENTDRKAYIIVPPNSFAYNPARINVGSIGYYEGAESVIVSSLYEVFQTADCVDDKFLWYWLKSDDFPKWIEKLQEGSVRLYFYYDKLCECKMMMPSVEEQRKISSYLTHLDNLITLHQRKLEKLKQFKSGLLDKMFI